jgi:hypothetical protein
MERVQELIDKLGKQHQQQESPERMLQTVQILQELLLGMVRKEAPAGGKVAVVLPPKRRATTVEIGGPAAQAPKPVPAAGATPAAPIADTKAGEGEGQKPYVPAAAPVQEKSTVAPEVPATPQANIKTAQEEGQKPYEPEAAPKQEPDHKEVAAEVPAATEAQNAYIPQKEPQPTEATPEIPAAHTAYMPVPEPTKEKAPYLLQKPPVAEPAAPAPPPAQSPQWEEREVYHLHFDTPDEAAPTLTQQQYGKAPKELHEMIGETKESLNDRLKQDKPELAHKLKEAPIKDLRKAIGVNDKFLFVRELFREDEAMYERSLKTINNFHILAEAEYWISRELKVKLGWDDSSQTVQAFYQLVKRRFS